MLPTREHPWNDRLVSAKHHQRLARLGSLHRLTRGWTEGVQTLKASERAQHMLTRGLSAEISQGLWMLERLSSQGAQQIQPLLDDTTPDDVLGRLDRTVWSVQTWILQTLRAETSENERAALEAVLEQVAWKQGRQAAEESWAGVRPSDPEAKREVGLRPLLLALGATLLNGGTGASEGGTSECFLVQRALEQEVFLELRTCPHQQPYCAALAPPETVDRLCELHSHWMRGFAYTLNSRAGVEHMLARKIDDRCRQRWYLVS